MDLDELRQRWRHESDGETHVALDAGNVSAWIEAKTRDVNRDIRRRLRQETLVYLIILLAPLSMLSMQGFTSPRVILAAGLIVAVGAIIGTLWYSERRLTTQPLDRSTRQVLTDLVTRVDETGRAYEIAYTGFIACAIAAAGIMGWRQTSSLMWIIIAIPSLVIAVIWARRSGRAYVNRMFGPYRAELADCLRELEKP
jgi:hypothetical protein